jgi:hypothetical protein
VSHHASGWTHFKTFDKPLLPPEKRQKPDASFSGTEQVVTTPVTLWDQEMMFGGADKTAASAL